MIEMLTKFLSFLARFITGSMISYTLIFIPTGNAFAKLNGVKGYTYKDFRAQEPEIEKVVEMNTRYNPYFYKHVIEEEEGETEEAEKEKLAIQSEIEGDVAGMKDKAAKFMKYIYIILAIVIGMVGAAAITSCKADGGIGSPALYLFGASGIAYLLAEVASFIMYMVFIIKMVAESLKKNAGAKNQKEALEKQRDIIEQKLKLVNTKITMLKIVNIGMIAATVIAAIELIIHLLGKIGDGGVVWLSWASSLEDQFHMDCGEAEEEGEKIIKEMKDQAIEAGKKKLKDKACSLVKAQANQIINKVGAEVTGKKDFDMSGGLSGMANRAMDKKSDEWAGKIVKDDETVQEEKSDKKDKEAEARDTARDTKYSARDAAREKESEARSVARDKKSADAEAAREVAAERREAQEEARLEAEEEAQEAAEEAEEEEEEELVNKNVTSLFSNQDHKALFETSAERFEREVMFHERLTQKSRLHNREEVKFLASSLRNSDTNIDSYFLWDEFHRVKRAERSSITLQTYNAIKETKQFEESFKDMGSKNALGNMISMVLVGIQTSIATITNNVGVASAHAGGASDLTSISKDGGGDTGKTTGCAGKATEMKDLIKEMKSSDKPATVIARKALGVLFTFAMALVTKVAKNALGRATGEIKRNVSGEAAELKAEEHRQQQDEQLANQQAETEDRQADLEHQASMAQEDRDAEVETLEAAQEESDSEMEALSEANDEITDEMEEEEEEIVKVIEEEEEEDDYDEEDEEEEEEEGLSASEKAEKQSEIDENNRKIASKEAERNERQAQIDALSDKGLSEEEKVAQGTANVENGEKNIEQIERERETEDQAKEQKADSVGGKVTTAIREEAASQIENGEDEVVGLLEDKMGDGVAAIDDKLFNGGKEGKKRKDARTKNKAAKKAGRDKKKAGGTRKERRAAKKAGKSEGGEIKQADNENSNDENNEGQKTLKDKIKNIWGLFQYAAAKLMDGGDTKSFAGRLIAPAVGIVICSLALNKLKNNKKELDKNLALVNKKISELNQLVELSKSDESGFDQAGKDIDNDETARLEEANSATTGRGTAGMGVSTASSAGKLKYKGNRSKGGINSASKMCFKGTGSEMKMDQGCGCQGAGGCYRTSEYKFARSEFPDVATSTFENQMESANYQFEGDSQNAKLAGYKSLKNAAALRGILRKKQTKINELMMKQTGKNFDISKEAGKFLGNLLNKSFEIMEPGTARAAGKITHTPDLWEVLDGTYKSPYDSVDTGDKKSKRYQAKSYKKRKPSSTSDSKSGGDFDFDEAELEIPSLTAAQKEELEKNENMITSIASRDIARLKNYKASTRGKDVVGDSGLSLFKVITNRYFKSGYKRVMDVKQ